MQRLEATEERRVGRFVVAASEIVPCGEPFPVEFRSSRVVVRCGVTSRFREWQIC